MQRTLVVSVAALLVLPLAGCGKIQARAELKKGNSYYTQEQYAKALDYYKQGLQHDPDATFAWRSVGYSALALYRPGDNDPKNQQYATTAIDAFEKYLAENPDDTKIEDYLMATYVNAEKYNEALSFIDRRIQERPAEAGKLEQARVNILTKADRLDEAFKMADKLQGADKAKTLYAIGSTAWDKVYHDPGKLDADGKTRLINLGLDALKQALAVDPNYVEAMVYNGLLYREKSKIDTDGAERLADETTAHDWTEKAKAAMAARKKAADQQAASPAKT
ncbi:MAG TPA: tetratricopeptide repeat protein [Thermoanaerobaculia bacterium]|nr:tetratricopeptide repeat protein [Thermoanaerobaculia bacterium]